MSAQDDTQGMFVSAGPVRAAVRPRSNGHHRRTQTWLALSSHVEADPSFSREMRSKIRIAQPSTRSTFPALLTAHPMATSHTLSTHPKFGSVMFRITKFIPWC